MNKIKALHIASFNGNIGDNANHNGFRNKLIETLGTEIYFDELEMREFYKSWNIRDFNSDEFVEKCNDYDLVIIGGGNFFELKWDYSYTGTTVNISKETLRKISTPIFFHGVGCDIAKGASDSTIKKFDEFLENVTKSDRYLVSVRNDGSYDTIKSLYQDKYDGRIHKVADGAFFLKTKPFYYPELNNKYKSLGINVVADMKSIRFGDHLKNGIEYNQFIEGFANEVNKFLETYKDYQIILFPHIYSDLIAIYELLEKIDDKNRRTRVIVAPCLTGKGSEEYIFGLYNKCDLVLGMRFHSNVCSIALNVPTIGLSSYKKIHDLYSELDLLDRVVNVNEINFEERLNKEIEYSMNNLEEIKNNYKNVIKNLHLDANNFYQIVKEWAKRNGII